MPRIQFIVKTYKKSKIQIHILAKKLTSVMPLYSIDEMIKVIKEAASTSPEFLSIIADSKRNQEYIKWVEGE